MIVDRNGSPKWLLGQRGRTQAHRTPIIDERMGRFFLTAVIGSADDSIVTLYDLNAWHVGFAAHAFGLVITCCMRAPDDGSEGLSCAGLPEDADGLWEHFAGRRFGVHAWERPRWPGSGERPQPWRQ